jgi:hypothetical protein
MGTEDQGNDAHLSLGDSQPAVRLLRVRNRIRREQRHPAPAQLRDAEQEPIRKPLDRPAGAPRPGGHSKVVAKARILEEIRNSPAHLSRRSLALASTAAITYLLSFAERAPAC